MISQYFATGKVGAFSASCYSDALRHLDADARLYSGIEYAIRVARFQAALQYPISADSSTTTSGTSSASADGSKDPTMREPGKTSTTAGGTSAAETSAARGDVYEAQQDAPTTRYARQVGALLAASFVVSLTILGISIGWRRRR